MCTTLKDAFNINGDLLTARREKLIPKEGYVEEIYFSFHGIGCYFEYENGHIDIDFGPNGRCNGFDEYRLYDFVTGMDAKHKNEYFDILEETELKTQFSQLKDLGIIENPKLSPVEHLYFLSERVMSRE